MLIFVRSGFLQLRGRRIILWVGKRGSVTRDSVGPRNQNLRDILPLGG